MLFKDSGKIAEAQAGSFNGLRVLGLKTLPGLQKPRIYMRHHVLPPSPKIIEMSKYGNGRELTI